MHIHKTLFSRITIISGSPGTGKSTLSRRLAETSANDKSVHLEIDDFWQAICKGYVHPWLDGSGDQNEIVAMSVAASALAYSKGGYEVFVAGTIGPWLLEPWVDITKQGIDVRYIILRPDQGTTVARATQRQQRDFFPLNVVTIQDVWRSFTNLGQYEAHVLDTTGQSIDESVVIIKEFLLNNQFRL